MSSENIGGAPRTAVVVGAGVVGLSTAWFLQDRGVDVTVLDRDGVAAGSSWGNAGWLSPALSIPLPEPSVLRYGLLSLLDRNAPLSVPGAGNPKLWSFLTRFAAHCTMGAWRRSMQAYIPVNAECLQAYDVLASGGVDAPLNEAPVIAAFEKREQAHGLLHEMQLIRQSGQNVEFSELSGDEVRAHRPHIASRVESGIRLEGQRYVDPGQFVQELARSVVARGGAIRDGFTATSLSTDRGSHLVHADHGDSVRADAVVLANGAWINRLGKPYGVRMPVRAGRGYSFTVPTDGPVPGPMYLPAVRVACTPYQGGLRVAGTMEFRDADAPLDRKRIETVIASARPLLDGVSWEQSTDHWVGPRPVTPDGLPLIGASHAPGVFVAGGHGMWGLTLGPVTGRLLAEQITTGKQPEDLRPFDPTR